jgi:hypothetical protein
MNFLFIELGFKSFPFLVTPVQKHSLEDLTLYITKGYQLLSSIENILLQRLVLCQCGWAIFFKDVKIHD